MQKIYQINKYEDIEDRISIQCYRLYSLLTQRSHFSTFFILYTHEISFVVAAARRAY